MKRVLGRKQHQRRSIRLRGYDYRRPGAYYVTLCTQDRACLFGQIVDGHMEVNDAGRMVLDTWHLLSNRFPTIDLDAFIVMPNHVHGIIVITANDAHMAHRTTAVGAGLVPAHGKMPAHDRATTRVAPTLGDVIGAYKSVVTVQYARAVNTRGWPRFRKRLWQRNYHEHVIRNADSLNRIRQYILDNPRRWDEDRYNPNMQEGDE